MAEIDFLDPILTTFRVTLLQRLTNQLLAVYLSGSAQMITWGKTKGGIPIAFEGPPIQEALNWAEKHCAQLVTQMDAETKTQLAKIISDGIENKRGIEGIARDIRSIFTDMSRERARIISRTETRSALFHASQDSMESMGVTGKEWVTAGGDACDICLENEAVGIIPVDEEFPTPQYDIHPNCLLPENMVLPLGLIGASRAWYEGVSLELKTRRGHRLTITPNHMILTPKGFIKAKSLCEGDDVIHCLDSQRVASIINPDNDQMPTRFQEIWDSLFISEGSTSISVPTSPVDFHSDAVGFKGNVDIVFPASLLGSCNHTSLADKAYKLPLNRRLGGAIFLSGGSSGLQFFNGTWLSSYGAMRWCRKCGKFISSHSGESQSVRLTAISRLNTSFQKSSSYPVAVNAHCLAKSQFGFPLKVTGNDYITRDRFQTRIGRQSVSLQESVKGSARYAELANKFLKRFSIFVTTDEITKIRHFNFSGHVYDLQSMEQLYISQGETSSNGGLILKNCRCAIAPANLPTKERAYV